MVERKMRSRVMMMFLRGESVTIGAGLGEGLSAMNRAPGARCGTHTSSKRSMASWTSLSEGERATGVRSYQGG